MHLSDYMTRKNLSDEAVAEKIGTTRATVSRIRRRKVRPEWATIRAISRFTGNAVTANDFVEMEPAE